MRLRALSLALTGVFALTATAVADAPPTADPTTPPVYTPTPGTGAVYTPAPIRPSGKLGVLGRHRVVLDPRRLRTTVEVQCRSAATARCDATGTLTVTLHGRPTQIGAWAGHIPGQHLATPRFVLSRLARQLRRGHAVRGTLRLTDRAHRARAAGVTPVSPIVVTIPVTVLIPRPSVAAPAVTTGPASSVVPPGMNGFSGPGTALVAGIIDPQGSATSYRFEFGPVNGVYDHTVPAADLTLDGDGAEHVVTATLKPFGTPGTIHYRLVATNDGGTTFGDDEQFTPPLVLPPPGAIPVPDTTIAGPVTPIVQTNQCLSVGPMVRGATVQCTLSVLNPQPPVFAVGAQQFAVRPATIVIAVHAPAGMIGATTHSPTEPLQITIPPSATAVGTVAFTAQHLLPLGVGEIAEVPGGPASQGTMPSFAHAHLNVSIGCPSVVKIGPNDTIPCTATVVNTGTDSADVTGFTMSADTNLEVASTSAGHPPMVLLPGASASVTERFVPGGFVRVSPGPRITVTVTGRDETDGNAVQATATSAALNVHTS